MKTEVIADLGLSHGGSVVLAIDLIDSAKEVGFTAVQFEKSSVKEEGGLSTEDFKLIDNHCKDIEMDWGVSVGSEECAEVMTEFNLRWVRMPKGKGYFLELLKYCIKNFPEVRVSTEMMGWNSIKILHRLLHSPPSDFNTGAVPKFDRGLPLKRTGVIFHAGIDRPIRADGCGMRAIERMRIEMQSPRIGVGYSGNDQSIHSGAVAVAYGATVIEKPYMVGDIPYAESMEVNAPSEWAKQCIDGIREAENMIGSSVVFPIRA